MSLKFDPKRPIKIAPSILSADFAKLGQEITDIEAAGADWIHVDPMDGHFVPNITLGPNVVAAIRPYVKTPMDVHLMIAPVDLYLEPFANAGADILTVHAEAGPHLDRTISEIRRLGCKAGVALNVSTPLSVLEFMLDKIDLILIMTINPGFGGQKFIPMIEGKIEAARQMIGNRPIWLEVDGGINQDTAGICAHAGADVFVAGSAVFGSNDVSKYANNIEILRNAANKAIGK